MNNMSEWLIKSEMDYSLKALDSYKRRNRYFSLSSLFNAFCLLVQNGVTYGYLIYSVLAERMTMAFEKY